MFDMALPWWEFVLRTVAVYRVPDGHGAFLGQAHGRPVHSFDLVVVMLLAEAVTDSLTGGDESLARRARSPPPR